MVKQRIVLPRGVAKKSICFCKFKEMHSEGICMHVTRSINIAEMKEPYNYMNK